MFSSYRLVRFLRAAYALPNSCLRVFGALRGCKGGDAAAALVPAVLPMAEAVFLGVLLG